jgi:flagellar motor switch protein FliM
MAPILIKLDRSLSYGIIDALAGGNGKEYQYVEEKEFTVIDLTVLKDIGDIIIADLNEAWSPVENIKAQYIRTEINPQFVGIIPTNAKVVTVIKQVEFNKTKGVLEILYPYSTLFPVRDKLFTNE